MTIKLLRLMFFFLFIFQCILGHLINAPSAYCAQGWKLFKVDEINDASQNSQHHQYKIEFLLDHGGVKGEHKSAAYGRHQVGLATWNAPAGVIYPGSPIPVQVQLMCKNPLKGWGDGSKSRFSVSTDMYTIAEKGTWIKGLQVKDHFHSVIIGGEIHEANEGWTTEWFPPEGAPDQELRVSYSSQNPGGQGTVVFRYRYTSVPNFPSPNTPPLSTQSGAPEDMPGDDRSSTVPHGTISQGAVLEGFVLDRNNTKHPMVVTIDSVDSYSGKFSGSVSWPSLRSLHRIEGTFTATTMTFKEVSYIQRGSAHLSCEYDMVITAGTLDGQWIEPGVDRGTVHLKLSSSSQGIATTSPVVGRWAINANNYTGILEITGDSGNLSARMFYDVTGKWETMADVKYNSSSGELSFRRPWSSNPQFQKYRGKVASNSLSGTFTDTHSVNKTFPWIGRK